MPLRFAHAADFHLDEDHDFSDTAQCPEWIVADAIRAGVDFFAISGDLTIYKGNLQHVAE
jgi:DNA repair exonuclease SbcCD nuclease subunit